MKKTTVVILITLLTLFLTACGASGSTTPATVSQADPSTGALSGPSLLIIGTLKLKDTGQAITPEQATELLPLWQVYQSLINSDTAAQAEIDAVISQIQDTLTSEQMKAIDDMKLAQQDSFALMQEMGLDTGMGGSRQSGDTTNSGNNNNGFAPPGGDAPSDMGGGGPGGGMPGQGPGGGQGQGLSQNQIATAQAARPAGAGLNRVPPALLEAFIQYLQERAGS